MAGLLVACSRLQPASLESIDRWEARWQADPVLSYHIVVDVESPGERRRNEVTIRENKIAYAETMYWDWSSRKWKASSKLDRDQAFPFTVPGLFDVLRGELRAGGRSQVRVAMSRHPAFPSRIVLGPVLQDGRAMPDTTATLTVASFGQRNEKAQNKVLC